MGKGLVSKVVTVLTVLFISIAIGLITTMICSSNSWSHPSDGRKRFERQFRVN